MDAELQRTVAAWAVVVLGGASGFLVVSHLEGQWAFELFGWYVATIGLATVAGALPTPWHPLTDRQ